MRIKKGLRVSDNTECSAIVLRIALAANVRWKHWSQEPCDQTEHHGMQYRIICETQKLSEGNGRKLM